MIEAVSAMLVCGDEIFVIKRQPHLRAFPGYHAFPGGKIDEEDTQSRLNHSLVSQYTQPHIVALHRELAEELQFDFQAELDANNVIKVDLFGTAVTPASEAIRFSAHYYKIVLTAKPEFDTDDEEIAASWWLKPAQLKEQYFSGQAMMVVPMRNAINALVEDISLTSTLPFNVDELADALPCLEVVSGLKTLSIPSKTLPPAIATNALLLGDEGQPQVLVDPSPNSDDGYSGLIKTLSSIDAILITHHHPDHHERAFDLARLKKVPVLLTAITLTHLYDVYGEAYVDGVEITLIEEGDEITYWKGSPIQVYELPGHDDGMVGLAPDTLAWFFIADLAQGQGSIFIPERGGDLSAYYQSLERVIALNPDVILPSHGIPVGGTDILKRTLRHRKFREQQISELKQQGQTLEQMVASLYPNLDDDLTQLALQNVRQHLRKLENDAV